MINILEDLEDQNFFVYDAERHEAIEGSTRLLEAIHDGKKEDNEENRLDLKGRITPVFGFRLADKLFHEDPKVLMQALEDKRKRQLDLKFYLERKIEEARIMAQRVGLILGKSYPNGNKIQVCVGNPEIVGYKGNTLI